MRKTKPVDVENYKGYQIVLKSFGWDEQFQVVKDGKVVATCQDRTEARRWVDENSK